MVVVVTTDRRWECCHSVPFGDKSTQRSELDRIEPEKKIYMYYIDVRDPPYHVHVCVYCIRR